MATSPNKVRLAEPADLPKLEALKLEMSYPGSLFYDEESYYQIALARLRDCLSRLDELPDCRILVLVEEGKPSGYLLFVVDQEHGVTHQLQALILDYAAFSFDGLQALVTRAHKIVAAFENEYMVIELTATDQRQQLWFYRCGFRAEQHRAVKRIPRGHKGASTPAYRIRKARPEDLPFILEVHATNTRAYLPAGRDIDLETLEFRYQLTYVGLDLDGSDGSLYFIMEEVSSGVSAGYIFIQEGSIFGTTPSYYVYDVAIAAAFAGRGLSLYLIGAAETLAGQKGAILYGDGTLGTPVIGSWHAQMGYVVDSMLFALDCRRNLDDVKNM
jgi:GNAT superfamily N-acetyltransferase